MTRRPRVAFCYFHPPDEMPSYVARDFETLAELGDVEWVRSQPRPAWRRHRGPTGWLPDRATRSTVAAADLVFQWFATPSAPVLAARLAKKPSIVIAGGFDVASLPEIDYGRMAHPVTRAMGRLTLRTAQRVCGCVGDQCRGDSPVGTSSKGRRRPTRIRAGSRSCGRAEIRTGRVGRCDFVGLHAAEGARGLRPGEPKPA